MQHLAEDTIPSHKVDQAAAAAHLGMTARWLELMRHKGGGPPYYKLGRLIRYDLAELDAYLAERRFGSTAEYDADAADAA